MKINLEFDDKKVKKYLHIQTTMHYGDLIYPWFMSTNDLKGIKDYDICPTIEEVNNSINVILRYFACVDCYSMDIDPNKLKRRRNEKN